MDKPIVWAQLDRSTQKVYLHFASVDVEIPAEVALALSDSIKRLFVQPDGENVVNYDITRDVL